MPIIDCTIDELEFQPHPVNRQFIDRTGDVFGRLTVLGYAGKRNANPAWFCSCSCAEKPIKVISGMHLKSGATVSCGCAKKDHDMSKTAEYRAWSDMKDRCYNPNNRSFHRYGGRGITVCARWIESFENFYADVGPRPSDKHSLDRIENEKGYSPDNVRYTTMKVQQNNKQNNTYITIDGRTQTLKNWCSELGIYYKTAIYRRRRGWCDYHALMHKPVLGSNQSNGCPCNDSCDYHRETRQPVGSPHHL